MALTNNDYRAALLQVYKACRYNGKMGQRVAFVRAKSLIHPLPDDFETACMRVAVRAFPSARRAYGSEACPMALWKFCWRYAREQLRP